MAAAEGTSGAVTAAAMVEAGDGPVLSMMSKRLRALRKKYNRILQMEERLAQGKTLNKEQEEVFRSKDAIAVLIEEYEKLRVPLSAAVQEELSLARLSSPASTAASSSPPSPSSPPATGDERQETKPAQGQVEAAAEAATAGEGELQRDPDSAVEDLLNLLYFGCLFDMKTQSEFASMVFRRTHERECCLTYDYVTDDSTGFLQEGDLDLISALGSLIISRPAHSSVSHKNALLGCLQHAKLWLCNSNQSIQPGSSITYAGLRERLNKILASDYFTKTPEFKAPVDVAAAVGKYASYQVQVSDSAPQPPSSHLDIPPIHHQSKEDNSENYEINDSGLDQSNTLNDYPKTDESDILETSGDANAVQHEQHRQLEDEQSQKDTELMEQQHVPRRSYQNQRGSGRGGSGGGRRGFGNGRGNRGGRGGGGYQNGRSQYYDPGYYPRNYYNSRGRVGRSGASAMYNNTGPTDGGRSPGNIELGASS